MRVLVHLTGLTPLAMHNDRLADPDDPISRSIAQLTGKRKKTEADRADIARLEWYGGIYFDQQLGVYLRTWALIRCFMEAGKRSRKGKDITGSLAALTDRVPLLYDGPRGLDALWADEQYRWRAIVGVQRNRVVRMRPIFRTWAVKAEFELLENVLSLDDFTTIVEQAGRTDGLGDARLLGNGRYQTEVRHLGD